MPIKIQNDLPARTVLERENVFIMDENLYVYTRTLQEVSLLVICNFTEKEIACEVPERFANGQILIGNYQRKSVERHITLQPYEALTVRTVQG